MYFLQEILKAQEKLKPSLYGRNSTYDIDVSAFPSPLLIGLLIANEISGPDVLQVIIHFLPFEFYCIQYSCAITLHIEGKASEHVCSKHQPITLFFLHLSISSLKSRVQGIPKEYSCIIQREQAFSGDLVREQAFATCQECCGQLKVSNSGGERGFLVQSWGIVGELKIAQSGSRQGIRTVQPWGYSECLGFPSPSSVL